MRPFFYFFIQLQRYFVNLFTSYRHTIFWECQSSFFLPQKRSKSFKARCSTLDLFYFSRYFFNALYMEIIR